MALSEFTQRALRALWEEVGGEMDNLREFWGEVRQRGLNVKWLALTAFMASLSISDETRKRVQELWDDHQSSIDDLLARAKRAGIPLTHEQASKFVKEQASRESERFLTPPRDGESFALDPRSEWKMDVVYMPDDGGYKYILLRINSFTRELDGIALRDLTGATMRDAMPELLGDHPPRKVLTDGGREFAACDAIFEERGIFHEIKEKGDYGAFAILDGSIGKLKRMLRIEGTEKAGSWRGQLARVFRIFNARANKSLGVSPESATVDGNSTDAEKKTAALSQFRIYEHMSQNILHNIALHKKKVAKLEDLGGARLPLNKAVVTDDPKVSRRAGPWRRADDPKMGDTERLLGHDYSFGELYTEEGKRTNLKLVIPSRPPAPRPVAGLSMPEKVLVQGLFALILNDGPVDVREAHQYLRDSGMNMRLLSSKFTFPDALRQYASGMRVENDVVFLRGDFEHGTLRFRVEQEPRTRRDYEPRIRWLPSKEISPDNLGKIADIEKRYAESQGRDPPVGWDLVRRVARYVVAFDTDNDVESWLAEFEARSEKFQTDPADIRDDTRLTDTMANRPPWKLREMRMALSLGWFPGPFKPSDVDGHHVRRDIRARITGWTTTARHWCGGCHDLHWCRPVPNRERCSRETFKPASAVYKATDLSLGFMFPGEIAYIGEWLRSRLEELTLAEKDAGIRWEETVLKGLRAAEQIFEFEETYDVDDIRAALDSVHNALRELSDDDDVLKLITRAMNDEVSGPRSDARRNRLV